MLSTPLTLRLEPESGLHRITVSGSDVVGIDGWGGTTSSLEFLRPSPLTAVCDLDPNYTPVLIDSWSVLVSV